MLHDVFICHASEDKEPFVRPLAEALRAQHIEVWYDEFALKLGDSIRQSIDRGLLQSRFGVVVFSKAFFDKKWPQYELDGLVEREMKGGHRVLLPIWHGVTHDEVMKFIPSLAGRKAALSSAGIEQAVEQILEIVRPQGSPLIQARDTLLKWGVTPPVVTDEYWLDVVEASNRTPGYGPHIPDESIWGRWSFPLPDKGTSAVERGDQLAWTAMQLAWVKDAEANKITPLSRPDDVYAFIVRNPGLLETCQVYPGLAVEYAPQLAIPGNEGDLYEALESAYQASCKKYREGRCEDDWSIRHPKFGGHEPYTVAHAYFHGGMFGPDVSPYQDSEHVFWLLSSASDWLPRRIHKVLLDGLTSATFWLWKSSKDHDPEADRRGMPPLWDALYEAVERRRKFRWSMKVEDDIRKRVDYAVGLLQLPESTDALLDRIRKFDLVGRWVAAERNMRRKRVAREKANKASRTPRKRKVRS